MKSKIFMIIVSVLYLNISLSAMVIHNYGCEKEEVIRTESGIFNEDYLFLGHELNFSGEAEDLLFLGKRLTFDGTTKLGLIAVCEKLIYSGMSGNGIIAGGMDVVINGNVKGNSYIGCKSLSITDKAVVNGNLFVGCAKLSLEGSINGDIYIYAGEMVVNNEIHGNVIARGGRIIIGENGKIVGNLNYSAKEKLSDKEIAKVTGTITIDESHKNDKDWADFVKFIKSIRWIICLGLCFSLVVVGCLLLFLPVFRKLDAKQSSKTFWRTALWGLVPVLMYPAIIIMSIILIVTIPFAIVLILAFVPLFFIANIIGTTLIGKYLVTKFKWKVEKRHYQFLIGVLAGTIVCFVPFINFLAMIFTFSLGWGVYLSFLFNKNLTPTEQN